MAANRELADIVACTEPLTTSWRDLPHYPKFMFVISGRDVFVRFPYRFMATISASLTAIFAYRRCLSFSVRTMITVTAVMVGLIWWLRRRSKPLQDRSSEYMDRLEARSEEIVALLQEIHDKLDARD